MRSMLPAAALVLAGLCAAQGAPSGPERVERVAAADPPIRPAALDRDGEATCSRARRRLWIEAEGWVVRRVTTCR